MSIWPQHWQQREGQEQRDRDRREQAQREQRKLEQHQAQLAYWVAAGEAQRAAAESEKERLRILAKFDGAQFNAQAKLAPDDLRHHLYKEPERDLREQIKNNQRATRRRREKNQTDTLHLLGEAQRIIIDAAANSKDDVTYTYVGPAGLSKPRLDE